ncbi:YCF48-related protein [Shewanella submarina]|uniref:WD40/YVTN/BNR-like repeat-containing protein n=1 Tax=Shewanella submarina TaxID=2016376 RepID=A0ABV7GDV8_9GAMM|nr:YCF48-related protein [Shewanella submarina]MCL1038113.1 YCF48-related protein [Shewanella submarina]
MRTTLAIGISLAVAAAGVFAFSPRHSAPLAPTRIPVDNMNITSLHSSSAGIIAAGELGHILISRDQGNSWQAASIDNQRNALITRVRFSDKDHGLAIGHEGWILRTQDGGESWNEISFGDFGSTPLLSLEKQADGDWLTSGAFGYYRKSSDNGASWQDLPPPQGLDWHLNSMIPGKDGQTWLLAGEAGTLLRSDNSGDNWQTVEPFYDGSFYGGLHLGGERWLVYGMRGNIFRSDDNGHSWQRLNFNIPVSLFTHEVMPDGELLLGGQGGFVISTRNQGDSFNIIRRGGRLAITDIHPLGLDKLLLASDKGLMTHGPTLDSSQNSSRQNEALNTHRNSQEAIRPTAAAEKAGV